MLPVRLGIDASGISVGGGLTHLQGLLQGVEPAGAGVEQVILWAAGQVVKHVYPHAGLQLVHVPALDGPLARRLVWQRCQLTAEAARHCDLLLVLSGTYVGSFRPFVTMAQNLLPFEPRERARYGLSRTRARLHLLEVSQRSTFRRADGVIFLTQHARQVVEQRTGALRGQVAVIPHGVSDGFRRPPRETVGAPLANGQPFRWLYTSIVDVYKHQWQVARAVALLRDEGLPVHLDLVGPAYPPALRRLKAVLRDLDPTGGCITYHGKVPYRQLAQRCQEADGFVFASSCETFGQVLLEAMASGMPIACSSQSAMPEILGDAGLYFDPDDPVSIAAALRQLMVDENLRSSSAWSAYKRAQAFSWERCASETFSFLASVRRSHTRGSPCAA